MATHTHDSRRHLPQLDSLRTFAVFAVMLGHFGPGVTEAVPLGLLGVRLFFVLSGFLITGILLDCRAAILDGAPAWGVLRRFYLRRFLRLLPPYYALLAVMWIVGFPEVRDSLPWHLAYASNVYFSRLGDWHGATSHFWSLAVEEQFYLIWPFVVLFQPTRRVAIALVVIAVAAPLFRVIGWSQAWSSVTMTTLPFASTDSLALGALLALWSRFDTTARARLSAVGGWLTPVAVVLTAMMALHTAVGQTLRDSCIATVWSLSFVWLVDRSARGFNGTAGKILENRAIVYLGQISYGLYLFHLAIPRILYSLWTAAGLNPPNAIVELEGTMLMTVVVAALSWRFYERPISRLKSLLPYDPRSQGRQESHSLISASSALR